MKWRMFFRQHTTEDGTEVGEQVQSPQEWRVVNPEALLEASRQDMRLLASVTDTSAVACTECGGEGVTEGIDFDEPYGRIDEPCPRCNGSGEEPRD